jgi:hypothetical protein
MRLVKSKNEPRGRTIFMNATVIRRGAAVLVAGVAMFAAGCGGDDSSDVDTSDPAAVVSALYAAAGDEDAAAMCDLLSADAQHHAAETEDEDSCEAGIEKSLSGGTGDLLSEIEVGEATVDGDTGTVEITALGQSDSVNVVQEDGEWKVDEDS